MNTPTVRSWEVYFADTSDDALVTMKQQQPVFNEVFNAEDVMSFTNLDNTDFDSSKPIQSVANGAIYMIIPLLSEQKLTGVSVSYESWVSFLKANKMHESTSDSGLGTSLYFFASIKDEGICHVRMFCDEHNMPREDAATGSAAGALLAYLLKHAEADNLRLIINQGNAVERPSELCIDGTYNGQKFDLKVGGRVTYVAKGKWG